MQFIFDSYKILKMRKYEFYKLDVFTDKLFTGNQLAVFTDAQDISDEQMLTK